MAENVVPFLRAALQRPVPQALFDPVASQIVVGALQAARAASDSAYRDRQEEIESFYQGDFLADNETLVRILFKTDADRLNEEYAGHDALNVIAMMTRTLAVVFHREPETYLRYRLGRPMAGQRLPETDPRVQQWRRDAVDLALGATLKQLDGYVVRFRTVVCQVEWRKGKVRWTPRLPHRTYIAQDPSDPSRIEDALAISVALPQPTSVLNVPQPLQYQTWFRQGADAWRMYLHDLGGTLYTNSLFPDHVNRYGLYPFVVFRDSLPEDGAFWLPERQDWWSKQRQINMALIDLWNIMHHQGFSTPVFERWAGERQGMAYGPGIPVVIEADGRFTWQTPQPNLDALEQLVENSLRRAAVAEGLPSDTWTKDGATRNLGALKLLRQPLEERRKERQGLYDPALRALWDRHVVVTDFHAAEGGRVRYGPDVELEVIYPPLPEPGDRFQDAQALEAMYRNGTASPLDTLMAEHGCTRERAAAMHAENLAMAARMMPRQPPPDAAAGATQRPADVRAGG